MPKVMTIGMKCTFSVRLSIGCFRLMRTSALKYTMYNFPTKLSSKRREKERDRTPRDVNIMVPPLITCTCDDEDDNQ